MCSNKQFVIKVEFQWLEWDRFSIDCYSYLSQIEVLKIEWILFIVSVVRIVIHHTAMRFGISPRKALSMCRLCCPLGTVNTLGGVLVMAYCVFFVIENCVDGIEN